MALLDHPEPGELVGPRPLGPIGHLVPDQPPAGRLVTTAATASGEPGCGAPPSWPQPPSPKPEEQVPGGEVSLDSPGLGDRLPPGGEISDHPEPPSSDRAPLPRRPGERAPYDAFRALGNRWLEVRWHGRRRGLPEDQTVHVTNRNRTPGRAV